MKIAIHKCEGSFSDRWISYCQDNNIEYKIVNCFDNDIIAQLRGCTGLMWHWNQEDYKALLFARQLTLSLENQGFKVFPNINTAWHFDDKVGQKYLLEATGAPLVRSYVFYSKKDALNWMNNTAFPKVFKLRGGAGSSNVRLVKTKNNAQRIINKAFNGGFPTVNKTSRLKNRIWTLRRDKDFAALKLVIRGIGRLFIPTEIERFSTNQMGYAYFQDFIPENDFDTRLVVIGNRCFGLRRYNRKGDFRASGSGVVAYEPELFDIKTIQVAFDIAKTLNTQSIAFDFILEVNVPKVIEISYAFTMGQVYDKCQGYWDRDMIWHNKPVNPQHFIIEDFIENLKKQNPF